MPPRDQCIKFNKFRCLSKINFGSIPIWKKCQHLSWFHCSLICETPTDPYGQEIQFGIIFVLYSIYEIQKIHLYRQHKYKKTLWCCDCVYCPDKNTVAGEIGDGRIMRKTKFGETLWQSVKRIGRWHFQSWTFFRLTEWWEVSWRREAGVQKTCQVIGGYVMEDDWQMSGISNNG